MSQQKSSKYWSEPISIGVLGALLCFQVPVWTLIHLRTAIRHDSSLGKTDQGTEAATQMCSWEKVFWKYAANLQENNYAEVLFQ